MGEERRKETRYTDNIQSREKINTGISCNGWVLAIFLFWFLQLCHMFQYPPADYAINVHPLLLRVPKQFVDYFGVKRHFQSQDMNQGFRNL
jgi:hypothetical protein